MFSLSKIRPARPEQCQRKKNISPHNKGGLQLRRRREYCQEPVSRVRSIFRDDKNGKWPSNDLKDESLPRRFFFVHHRRSPDAKTCYLSSFQTIAFFRSSV